MDAPERNKISTSLSNLEGSPLFNYMNTLSPLKPVKSVHVTQAMNSLSFPPPPPVFTSPHVNKESRLLRRYNLLDTSKQAPTDSTDACHDSSVLQKNIDQWKSIGDSSIELSSKQHTKFQLPRALKYKYGSPGYYPLLSIDEANSLFDSPGELTPNVVYVEDGSKEDSIEGEKEMNHRGICQIEANVEGLDSNWNNLVSDPSDELIYSSPIMIHSLKGLMDRQLSPSLRLNNIIQQSTTDIDRIVNPVVSSSEHEIKDHPSELTIATDRGHSQTRDNLTNVALMASNPSEKMDNEVVHVTHHGTGTRRRRCLDFEMAGVQRNNSGDGSNISSSTTKSDERNIGNEKSLLPVKHTGDLRRCVWPGIGVHFNGHESLKDYKSKKNEMISFGGIVMDPSENKVHPTENCSQSSVSMAGEDFNQNNPKKKRMKLEAAGEGEACKRCNCKKSKCLKLYCECFSARVYCTEPCSCRDCFNKPINEDIVVKTRKQMESRNPLAFAPKVIRSSDSILEFGVVLDKTPAPARHKRGCNCKKSSCLKKYCECYQGGVGCSIICRCEGCKNVYGRKDVSIPAEIKAEPQEDKACKEVGIEKAEIKNTEDHPECAPLPTTPFRSLLPLPFSSSSKGKPPRSFVDTIKGSQSKIEKPFQTVPDNDDDDFPITCIKTSSPNSKRISTPKRDFGSSPTRIGGRKL